MSDEPRTIGIGNQSQSMGEDEESLYRQEFARRYRYSSSCFREWRAMARVFFDTYSGNPWPEEARDIMEEEGRPVTNFNFALSTANAILGQDMSDEKEARFRCAFEGGDMVGDFNAENLTRVVRHVYRLANIADHEYMAELDQLCTGYGYCEGLVNTTRFPHRIEAEYIDCFEVYPDPNYQMDNLSDARYIIRERRWSLEEAKAKWPDYAEDIEQMVKKQGNAKRPVVPTRTADATNIRRGRTIEWDSEDRSIFVYDYQRRRFEKFVGFRDPRTGMLKELPEKEFKKYREALFQEINPETGTPLYTNLESTTFNKEIVDRGYLAGTDGDTTIILEAPRRIKEDMFTIRCVTGFRKKDRDTGRVQHFGIIAVAYDPQLLAAKALSSGIEYIARGTKGGFLFDPAGIESPAKFITESNKPGYRGQTLPGALMDGKNLIQKLPDPVWNSGYDTIFSTAVNMVPYTTMATDALKGNLEKERSNVLIKNLQNQSLIALNPLVRPMAVFRREMSQLIGLLTLRYMATDQFNKILSGQKLLDVTYQQQRDPQTGEKIEVPVEIVHTDEKTGEPVLDPQTNQPAMRPITPKDLIMQDNIMDYLVTVDVGSASSSAKENFWRLFNDHALLNEIIQDQDMKEVMMPRLIENIPEFPAEDAKTMAKELRDRFEMRKAQGTIEGIQMAFEQMDLEQLEQVRAMLDQTEQAIQGEEAPQPNEGDIQ